MELKTQSDNDLVRAYDDEFIKNIQWKKVPAGTPVLVWNKKTTTRPYRRIFMRYCNTTNMVVTYDCGQCEWTSYIDAGVFYDYGTIFTDEADERNLAIRIRNGDFKEKKVDE